MVAATQSIVGLMKLSERGASETSSEHPDVTDPSPLFNPVGAMNVSMGVLIW